MCSNEDYFNVLVAQVTVTIQHQVCKAISRSKNIFLLSRLAIGYHKEEVDHARHSASTTPRDCTTSRDCTTLLYAVKKQRACKIVFCAACRAGLNKTEEGIKTARTHAACTHTLANIQRTHAEKHSRIYTCAHARTNTQTHTHTHTKSPTLTCARTHARIMRYGWQVHKSNICFSKVNFAAEM